MLDGVGAGLDRHALRVRCEAMHGRGFVKCVRFADDRVEFLLRHVDDVRLFLVGAATAGGAGLDHVAAPQQVGAREFAQFVGAVAVVEAGARHRARLDEVEMRTGDGGKAADQHARPFENPGIDRVAHGAQFLREQSTARIHPEVAQRRESHVEAILRMEERIHLLQLRRDFPLRDTVIVERHAIEHRRVDVAVHHAGHQGAAGGIDDLRVRRHLHGALGADRVYAVAPDQDHRIADDRPAVAIDEFRRGDDNGLGVRFLLRPRGFRLPPFLISVHAALAPCACEMSPTLAATLGVVNHLTLLALDRPVYLLWTRLTFQRIPVIRWIAATEHFPKYRVGIILATRGA